MKLVQASTEAAAKKILSIDQDTFAQLINVSNDLMEFKLSYLISLVNAGKHVMDYDRVIVTVLQPEIPTSAAGVPAASTFSGNVDGFEKYNTNFKIDSTSNKAPVQKGQIDRYVYPKPIADRLFAGKFLLQSINKKPNYISRKTSHINSALKNAVDKNFSTVEIIPSPIKRSDALTSKNSEIINHDSVIDGINRFYYDVTEPAAETQFSSNTDIASLSFKQDAATASFHKELLRYYLLGITASPAERSLVFFDKVKTVSKLTVYEGAEIVQVPITNKNLNIKVKFELYRIGALVPEETVTTQLNISRHFSAFTSITEPPHVVIDQDTIGNIKLIISDRNTAGKVKNFNIYSKSLNADGSFSEYKLVGSLLKSDVCSFDFSTNSKLSIVRVSPVNSEGVESNIFTSVVAGIGYENICSLTICPRYDSSGKKMFLDLYNIPRGTTSVLLYKRNCSKNINEIFTNVSSTQIIADVKTYSLADTGDFIPGDYFEYYAVALTKHKSNNPTDGKLVSNYALIRHPFVTFEGKPASINIKNFSSFSGTGTENSVDPASSPRVSFTIEAKLTREQKELITQLVKSQIPEIYEQFLNPANNSSSPLSDEKFSDLIIHEVVRINLSKSKREIFNLVADGQFVDDYESQKLSNVSPLDPYSDYLYQVFSFKKNPINLFKNYIISGIDGKGKQWFYSPYKWLQPSVIASGKLFAEDSDGNSLIDAYESLTSEPLGLTANKLFKSPILNSRINGTKAERLDRNVVLVSWNTSSIVESEAQSTNFYDSFVVMKVVNGVRSFVGRTSKKFIYHFVDEADMGSVYYIVVPIMKDFSFDNPDYSNDIIIDDKVVKKIMLPPVNQLESKNAVSK